MKDPRIAELELLAHLEREGYYREEIGHRDEGEYFGLPARAFRELVFALLEEGAVNGAAELLTQDPSIYRNQAPYRGQIDPRTVAAEQTRTDLDTLVTSGRIGLRIGHKGRLRLWRLRDELRADRGREQFGILYDRRAWERELAVQLPFATPETPLSLLFIDADHFKSVNDTLGHGEGDRVLKRIMEIVRDVLGNAGDGYRIGGDEFTAALPSTSHAQAGKLAETIRASVEKEFASMHGRTTSDGSKALANAPTVSIGAATFSKGTDPASATEFADKLVYKAKETGKNRVASAEHGG